MVEPQMAWLYADDQIVKAINDYLKIEAKYRSQNPETPSQLNSADAKIRAAIRKDLIGNTHLDAKWITSEQHILAPTKEALAEYLGR